MTTVSFVGERSADQSAPTLNPIPNPAAILENTNTAQIIQLSNILPALGDTVELVTVSAKEPAIRLDPQSAVTYINFNNLGIANTDRLALRTSGTRRQRHGDDSPSPVMNNGGTANGGVNTLSQTFTVTVTPVDQQPTLSAIAIPVDPRVPVQTPAVLVAARSLNPFCSPASAPALATPGRA